MGLIRSAVLGTFTALAAVAPAAAAPEDGLDLSNANRCDFLDPTTNTPNDQGVDPHGPDFSETPAGQKQIAKFLMTGKVFEVCPRRVPCYLDDWSGPNGG
ncbi:MAG TPA: hypothetical protein VEX36_05005 [Thermoleophilaceae bacterium]|nr:hypothetical protein [Thermoleophilaceae bacterium]